MRCQWEEGHSPPQWSGFGYWLGEECAVSWGGERNLKIWASCQAAVSAWKKSFQTDPRNTRALFLVFRQKKGDAHWSRSSWYTLAMKKPSQLDPRVQCSAMALLNSENRAIALIHCIALSAILNPDKIHLSFFFIRLDRAIFFRDYANSITRSARTSRMTVHQSLNRSSIYRFILFFLRHPRFLLSYFALLNLPLDQIFITDTLDLLKREKKKTSVFVSKCITIQK